MAQDTKRVLHAIDNMSTSDEMRAYFEKTVASRSLQTRNGSCYDLTPDQIIEMLKGASWETFNHSSISGGAVAFRSPLPGILGLANLNALPENTPIVFHDNKGTGLASVSIDVAYATEASVATDFTTIILGPDKNTGKEVVWTFFPGEPFPDSKLPYLNVKNIQKPTVGDALKYGFSFAKIEVLNTVVPIEANRAALLQGLVVVCKS